MFKNESLILKSWIDHYIREGIDHFYLIDNGSTDNFMEIINMFSDKITLVSDPLEKYKDEKFNNKQDYLYNKYFLEKIKQESKYAIVCDIDEYFYTKTNYTTLKTYLENNPLEFGINIKWKLFGTISKSIPLNLIDINVRSNFDYSVKNHPGYTKSIFNTGLLSKLKAHEPEYKDALTKVEDFDHEIKLNHYKIISEDYFKTVKAVRGGGSSGISRCYTMEYFYKHEKQWKDVEDNELKNKLYPHKQNANFIKKMIYIVYFFFVNIQKDWKKNVELQLLDVKKSGILDSLETEFHVVVCDPTKIADTSFLNQFNCKNILKFFENRYEYEALQYLQTLSHKANPDDSMIYFHSKGMVMHKYALRIPQEIKLTNFLFKDWKKTVQLMTKYEKAGLFPAEEGWIWFNFWWATAKYIKNCKPLITDLNNRHACESFLGRNGSHTYTDCISIHDFPKEFYLPQEACTALDSIR